MIDLGIVSYFRAFWSLRWRLCPTLYPLPREITRDFVKTPNGNIEIIHAVPAVTKLSSPKPAVLFVHGGFGTASWWIPWMLILAKRHSYPVFAVSLRGHGGSWSPSLLSLQFTSIGEMAKDVVAAIEQIQVQGYREIVLVGHSAGGGLVQYILNEGVGNVKVKGLVLLAAFPNYGGREVYNNWWFKVDPLFFIRGLFLFLNHPRSPLVYTSQVHNAFFSPEFPDSEIKEFEKWMSPSESMLWPIYYNKRGLFDVQKIIGRILGWETRKNGVYSQRLCVIAGSKDRLMELPLMQRMVEDYREGIRIAVERKKIDGPATTPETPQRDDIDGILESSEDGIRMVVVHGSGHHIQNDLQKDKACEALARFLDQL